jgi:hypothetical protein
MSRGLRGALIVAYYFPPENTSGAARPARFFRYLPEFGFDPVVVCGSEQPATPVARVHQAKSSSRLGESAARLAAQVVAKVARRHRDRLFWLPAAVNQAACVVESDRPHVIFSTHPPLSTHLAAMRIKRRFGLKWVADFRDPIAQDPRRTTRYESFMERLVFRHADAVVANTESSAAMWRERYPAWKNKVTTIWNGFDPEEPVGACPAPPRNFRLLVHAGDLYGPRHPGVLLASLDRLLLRGALTEGQLRLRLIGPIAANSPMVGMEVAGKLAGKGIVQSTGGLIPRAEALRELATADYLLLLDITAYTNNVQVPAKLFDYVRIGRPILAFTTAGSPAEQILSRSGVRHVCVYPTDTGSEVDHKVLSFLGLPVDPLPFSDWFSEQFNGREQTGALARVFESVL